MQLFIKLLIMNIISFIKSIVFESRKKSIDYKIEKSLKEDKDASKEASDDYDDFKSTYDEYRSSIRTDKL